MLFIFCFPFFVSAQVIAFTENFEDGNLTSNPTWSGSIGSYTVSNLLPLEGFTSIRGNTANAPSSISIQYGVSTNFAGISYSWSFVYKDNVGNPGTGPVAGQNAWRLWLAATSSNPATASGYAIKHGSSGTTDNIQLVRMDNGVETVIINSGIDPEVNAHSIRVTRNNNGLWELFINSGTSDATTSRGTISSTNYFNSGTSAIFMILQSNNTATLTNSNRFMWDNILMDKPCLTVIQLDNGISPPPLVAGSLNKAIFGFSLNTGVSCNFLGFDFEWNKNPQGNFLNYRLYSSVDNDYNTFNDNTLIPGANFSINGPHGDITGLNQSLGFVTKNFFVVVDVPNPIPAKKSNLYMSLTDEDFDLSIPMCTNDFVYTSLPMNFGTIFTWDGGSLGGDWSDKNNWLPKRSNPSADDILIINGGGTKTMTGIPALDLIMGLMIQDSTTVILSNTVASTINIFGDDSVSLRVNKGSTLKLSSVQPIQLKLQPSSQSHIYGTVDFRNAAHQITGSDTSSIIFENGGIFIAEAGFTGNPFGSLNLNTVVFQTGSTFIKRAGGDPFGAPAPLTVLKFKKGSYYKHQDLTAPSLSGRSYGNFEIDKSGFSQPNITGILPLEMYDLKITNADSVGMNLSSTINIRGDITVSSGKLRFDPSAGGTIYMNSDSAQVVSGSGVLWMNTSMNFGVQSASTVYLDKNLSVPGTLTVEGILVLQGKTLTVDGNFTGLGRIRGSDSASVIVNGTGHAGNINFDAAHAKLKIFKINRNGAVGLSQDVEVLDSLQLVNGSLELNGKRLTVKGKITGSGTITGSSTSKLNISGTGGGSVGQIKMTQTNSSSRKLSEFTLERTGANIEAELADSMEITSTVTVNNGVFKTNGKLKLISDASGTARIAALPAGTDVTGIVTTQRYIPGLLRKWMFVSSPMANFKLSDLKDDIFITGPGGASNGFDASGTNSPTAYVYYEPHSGNSENGWYSPTNTSTIIPPTTGMRIFFRGDRTQNGLISPFPIPLPTTSDFIGNINKGTFSAPITYTVSTPLAMPDHDGWNLVGNPYPSQIDWNASGWTKTNIESRMYIWNPLTNTYGVWDGLFGTNNVTGQIALGQAFFVKANGPNPVLTMTESVKTGITPSSLFKTNTLPSHLRIKMFKDTLNSDEIIIHFSSNGAKATDNSDAGKYMNTALNISSLSAGFTNLAINAWPLLNISDTIRLNVSAAVNGAYSMEFSQMATVNSQFAILLLDSFAQTTTDLRNNPLYTFTINSNVNSKGMGRFKIVFANLNSLPVSLVSFTGKKEGENVRLTWITATEENNSHFIVERSIDGKNFKEIDKLEGKGNSRELITYNSLDEDAFSADENILYYRLKQVDLDGTFDYSKVIAVTNDQSEIQDELVLFPNPAKDFINIDLGKSYDGPVEILILDVFGKVKESFDQQISGTNKLSLSVSQFESGVYFLKIKLPGKTAVTLKFIKS